MGGTSLQFLLTLILLLLCMKPTIANYLGLADTHLGCKEHERQALLKIKQDLIDDYGHLSSWSSDQDCCKWSGVRCSNQTGHVIMLNLNTLDFPSKPLRGKLNPSLIELKYLTYLDLSFNDFNMIQIPEFIASLSNLRLLGLRAANFGRNIPFQLGNLSNLQDLDLGGNHFNKPKNIEWLTQLSSLQSLCMSTVNLSKVNNWLQVVNKLPNLTFLLLSSCNLPNTFSVPLVNSSTSLDLLDLSSNNITSSSSVLEWLFKSNTSVVELFLSENQLQGLISDAFSRINSLAHLYLDSNEFEGEIPKAFGGMCNLKTLALSGNHLSGQLDFNHNLSGCVKHSLETLHLDQNQVMGSIPDLTAFPSLRKLSLFRNRLNGTIPESLGKQSNLESLSLGDNPLKGVISEAHFSKLTKLQNLDLSNTLLVFNINYNWIPPFQLKMISLGSCQLGPRFPKWLQTQKNFTWLDISNSGISDTLSNSNWIFSSQLWFLNLSQNQISGHVPNFSLKFSFSVIDLSSNKLEGEIPRFLFKASHLDLSKNMFSELVQSLCAVTNGDLNLLDLSNNQLLGELPDCWMHFEGLKILNLANNQFHGKIPSSMGSLLEIETLDLNNNSFSGELPPTLKSCAKLRFINLQNNNLSGEIPKWLGSNHPNLIVLFLRSNHFFGSIPSHLCHLIHLQVLDLALNQISGSIPKCLKDIIALTQKWTPNSTITHSFEFPILGGIGGISSSSYDDRATWMNKGREYEYKSTLGLLKSIDLSSNKLTGPIPSEIVELNGLISLNLSRNLLTGKIPSEIGLLHSLEALDLSKNQLCGGIPSSISLIDSLSSLNLSNNNLFGKIPTGSQLNTFDATAYEGNLNLCGFPLPKKCSREDTTQNPAMNTDSGHAGSQKEEDGFVTLGFYVSVTLGFVVGFWGVFGTMVLNRSWRFSYFKFLNNFKDKLYVTGAVIMVKLQRQLQTLLVRNSNIPRDITTAEPQIKEGDKDLNLNATPDEDKYKSP